MGRRFELIVFDWDGTLMDSTGAIVASIKAAATDLGITPPSDERASHIIGLGLIDALRHALPDLPAERYQDVALRYRQHYMARDQDLLLFAGAAGADRRTRGGRPHARRGDRQDAQGTRPRVRGQRAGIRVSMRRAAPTSAIPSRIRRCSTN
jgi:hypothetical protein